MSDSDSSTHRKPSRRIVTGEDVQALPEGSLLDVSPGTILTDVAREWIEKRKIRLVADGSNLAPKPAKLAIGSDHAGFAMKESLKVLLTEMGVSFFDLGTDSEASVDYPDFAHAVAVAVALGQAQLGIVLDGAGIGSAIVANKVPGIRAAACLDEAAAKNGREHNDVNVMTLGARMMEPSKLLPLVRTFLDARLTEARHRARVEKIVGVEKKYYRPV